MIDKYGKGNQVDFAPARFLEKGSSRKFSVQIFQFSFTILFRNIALDNSSLFWILFPGFCYKGPSDITYATYVSTTSIPKGIKNRTFMLVHNQRRSFPVKIIPYYPSVLDRLLMFWHFPSLKWNRMSTVMV